VRDGIARDLHDDIGSTLGSISYYSETLKRQIGAENDSAREVAEQIGQNSREMIDRMGDIVWSIDPRNDSTGSLEERMRTYATGLLVPNGIDLRFRPADADLAAPLNARTRRVLFLIFKEAVHNALKYAECTQIQLELRPVDGHLLLRVVDNGCGFDLEQARPYNGNGLRGMTTRASSVGGTAEVRSAPGEGTEVKVRVPL
jgi:signal transduction histidine kinase